MDRTSGLVKSLTVVSHPPFSRCLLRSLNNGRATEHISGVRPLWAGTPASVGTGVSIFRPSWTKNWVMLDAVKRVTTLSSTGQGLVRETGQEDVRKHSRRIDRLSLSIKVLDPHSVRIESAADAITPAQSSHPRVGRIPESGALAPLAHLVSVAITRLSAHLV